jgi:hypothetical protein
MALVAIRVPCPPCPKPGRVRRRDRPRGRSHLADRIGAAWAPPEARASSRVEDESLRRESDAPTISKVESARADDVRGRLALGDELWVLGAFDVGTGVAKILGVCAEAIDGAASELSGIWNLEVHDVRPGSQALHGRDSDRARIDGRVNPADEIRLDAQTGRGDLWRYVGGVAIPIPRSQKQNEGRSNAFRTLRNAGTTTDPAEFAPYASDLAAIHAVDPFLSRGVGVLDRTNCQPDCSGSIPAASHAAMAYAAILYLPSDL